MPKKTPKINDLKLPTVNVSAPLDLEDLAAKLATEPMSPEGLIETAIYLKRQKEKADALDDCIKVLTGRVKAFYDKLPPEKRETRRVKVGMATYTDAGEKVDIIDRDTTMETLTDEQIRITCTPNVKLMETILKAGDFERLTKKVPTPSRVTIRDNRASEEFEELDF